MATQTIAADYLAMIFSETRALTLALAAPLSDADATVQSMPDASPAKWHLAHTTWFFETFVLRDHLPGYRPFAGDWAYLFNSYYESEGERHPRSHRGMLTRPSLDEVRGYRAHVDSALLGAFRRLGADARWLVELGCQHEAQHQELLLSDILHLFAQNPLGPAYQAASPAPIAIATLINWIEGPMGTVEIGHMGDDFAFDCEAPRHTAYLAPYVVADRLVTNGEWDAFIADGGYRRPEHWLSDGWAWVQAEGIAAPLYWRDGDAFGLGGWQARNAAAPVVHVSHFEADAYARWAGARLPTEFEWEAVACDSRMAQMTGHVWQWTGSAFLPYPGYRPAPGAVGEYNGKFMSGQMVLRGGSVATPERTARPTTRNFFPPTARWQFSGLRLAKDR
jgi:ergothioneine biosynthesis protein EgtB